MNDKYETIQDPGHSGLGSGDEFVVGATVVVCVGEFGLGLGLGVVGADLVLSQQIEPLLQFDVCGINTDGRSQNAAIIFNKQKPGQRGPESTTCGREVVV